MAKELHVYDVLKRPLVSEKATIVAETLNQYTFEVDLRANKLQIRDAVEDIFDVDVVKVNTLIVPAKRGRRGRKQYIRKSQWKKAIVTTRQPIALFDQ